MAVVSSDLTDRILWFDGAVSTTPSTHKKYPQAKHVTEIDHEVLQYNRLVPVSERLTVKQHLNEFTPKWITPLKYSTLDVLTYVVDIHFSTVRSTVDIDEFDRRERRLCSEYLEFKKLNLLPVVRAIIWVINTMSQSDIVWGVGRGSSVSSYLLYVIGVHDVDSYKYDLPISDFLR